MVHKQLMLQSFKALFLSFSIIASLHAYSGVNTTENQGHYSLNEYLEILEDPSGLLTIDDVVQPKYDSLFIINRDQVPNFGFTESAYWVRFRIRNNVYAFTPWALELGFANMHYADLYQLSEDVIVKQVKTGTMRPLETRDYEYHRLVFLLSMPPNSEHTVYLRCKNEASMTIPLTLTSMNAFMNSIQNSFFRIGLFIGIFLIMIGYNLFLYIRLHETSYIYFSLFIACILLFGLSYEGVSYVYFWPDMISWNSKTIPLFNGLLLITLLLFTNQFLELRIRMPLWHKIVIISTTIIGGFIPFIFFLRYSLIINPMVLLSTCTFIFTLILAFVLWRKGYRPAKFYLLGLSLLVLSTILASLTRLGILPSSVLTEPQYLVGAIFMIILLTQGITDRIRLLKEEMDTAKLELKESEYVFRQFFEELPEAIFLSHIGNDRDGDILDVNPAAELQTGYSREELIGMNMLTELVADESEPTYHQEREEKLLSGDAIQFIEKKKRKDGTEYWTQVKISPIKIKNQDVALSINRDITKQKLAEDALHESEASLQALINAIPDPAFLIDRNYNLLVANHALARGFNKEVGEILHQNPLKLLPPDIARDRQEKIQEVFSTGKLMFFEDSRDGEYYINYICPVFDVEGYVSRIAIFALDISEQKKLENQLAQSQKMESIGTLAGGIAHDFNNILTVINGYADLALSRIEKSDKIYHNISEIRSASTRAENLTRQILAFSRKQMYQPKIVNINEIITGMEKMVRRLIGEDIDIEKSFLPDIPNIKADPGQLEQILINLVVNARDAINEKTEMASQKKITIETGQQFLDENFVSHHPGSLTGLHAFFAVSDNGIGMTEEVKQKIFDPFFTLKEKDKGTGLGLSTVYGIVKQNDGSIYVYSEPGKGSTLKIYWPVTDEERASRITDRKTGEALSGDETILFVEDEEQVRKFGVAALKQYGYRVYAVDNGIEALKLVEKDMLIPDLLITDLIMPKMNGKELSEKLKRIVPGIKIIFTSGYTENHIVHEGQLEQNINFLQKPYTFRSLALKVRSILD